MARISLGGASSGGGASSDVNILSSVPLIVSSGDVYIKGSLPSGDEIIGKVKITDGTDIADIIQNNGYKGLVVTSPGHISTGNSTSDVLAGGASFTGTAEDVTNFGVINIVVKASHDSATDGLAVEYSTDGTNWDESDSFTIYAEKGKIFSFQCPSKYFRVRYTNGSTQQTYFRLQTVLKPYYVKPSSHRILDAIIGQDDAELVKAILTAQKPDTTFTNIDCTAGGNLKVSVEEFDESASFPSGDNKIGAVDVLSSQSVYSGAKVVPTGTAEVIASSQTIKSVTVKSLSTNDYPVFLGQSGVTISNGFELLPGEALSLDSDNLSRVYCIASGSAQELRYIAI